MTKSDETPRRIPIMDLAAEYAKEAMKEGRDITGAFTTEPGGTVEVRCDPPSIGVRSFDGIDIPLDAPFVALMGSTDPNNVWRSDCPQDVTIRSTECKLIGLMLTIEELTLILEQIEASERGQNDSRCGACDANIDRSEPHLPDCRFVRVHDALRKALNK